MYNLIIKISITEVQLQHFILLQLKITEIVIIMVVAIVILIIMW